VCRFASHLERSPRRSGFSLVELLVVIAILALLVAIFSPSLNLAKELAAMVRCRAHLHQLTGGGMIYAQASSGYLPGKKGIVDKWWYEENVAPAPGPWGVWQPYRGWMATLPISCGLLARSEIVTNPEIWLCPKAKLDSPGDFYRAKGQPNILYDPYTYHFSVNGRTTQGYPGGHRSLHSFADASRTVILGEENTGWIPDSLEALNDPAFTQWDVSEPRHLGNSQVGFLDGHAEQMPPYLPIAQLEEYCPPP